MEWSLKFGPRLKELRTLQQAGHEVPALDREPDIPEFAEWYWRSWAALDRRRAPAFAGPGPIPYHEIEAYARIWRLPGEDLLELVEVIDVVEDAYQAFHAEKSKRGKPRGRN